MFREISIRKLTMLYCRQYWAVTKSLTLSVMYRFVYCCLTPLHIPLTDFLAYRLRAKLMAVIPWTYGSAQKYFQNNYASEIYFDYKGGDDTVWLSDSILDNEVWLTSDPIAEGVFLSSSEQGIIGIHVLIVWIPQSLADDPVMYPQFIADLNTLILTGITYKIKII